MTDDAYLFLATSTAGWQGTPLILVGQLECLDTPAVRAWFTAQNVSPASAEVRVVPPEETTLIPEGAERLPIPLAAEELERVRRAAATETVAGVEEDLAAFRDSEDNRDDLLRRALAAGVPAHRIVELSGVDPTTLSSVSGG
ncbi:MULTISPECIES: DUF6003 family protein [unclassified Streptomyces]|uniref:DUF6003 family protein n=1 Tax=unclassified Streptomyces TaxID=2593676 RepID=UPI0029A0ED6D|nr:DUF6003 family protein [Streptomyces sp. DK15]MDX2389185.1 DUF6003 family protein [Streptomyces sp. DK15]